MCDWCMLHGEGKKWYLEKRNIITKELFNDKKAVRGSMEWFFGKVEKKVAVDFAKALQLLSKPVAGGIAQRKLQKELEIHQGQIVPLEEAKAILNISSSAAIMSCVCRRMQLGKTEKCCIGVDYFTEYMKEWPDFTRGGINYVSKDEALELLESYADKGYVTSVWAFPVPFVGGFCNCEYPVCLPLKARIDLDQPALMRKAEFIVEKDYNLCIDCGKCVKICQFGAMKHIKTLDRTFLDISKCFGCGLCTRVCPEDALKLVPRETVPAVMEDW